MTTSRLAVIIVIVAIAGGVVGAAITLAVRGDGDAKAVERGQLVHLGPRDSLGDLAHTPFCNELHHFCITEPLQGQLLALYTADPHPSFREQGCMVRWDAIAQQSIGSPSGSERTVTGLFRDPCGGSKYDISGKRLFGPSPRDLDRFPIAITQDGIVVNTKTLICGGNRLAGGEHSCVRAPAID